MDEDTQLGIAECLGRTYADGSMITALVTVLAQKGIFKAEDVATLPGLAKVVLDAMPEPDPNALVIAQACLRGYSSSWSKLVTRN